MRSLRCESWVRVAGFVVEEERRKEMVLMAQVAAQSWPLPFGSLKGVSACPAPRLQERGQNPCVQAPARALLPLKQEGVWEEEFWRPGAKVSAVRGLAWISDLKDPGHCVQVCVREAGRNMVVICTSPVPATQKVVLMLSPTPHIQQGAWVALYPSPAARAGSKCPPNRP